MKLLQGYYKANNNFFQFLQVNLKLLTLNTLSYNVIDEKVNEDDTAAVAIDAMGSEWPMTVVYGDCGLSSYKSSFWLILCYRRSLQRGAGTIRREPIQYSIESSLE